jgi:tetratricopeptide (TPR) repeat protein
MATCELGGGAVPPEFASTLFFGPIMPEAREFRVFLSAVSSELETARNEIANDLDSRKIRVRIQRSFRQEAGSDTVLHLLHAYIASCTAVVCVMGKRSGAFPTPTEALPFAHMLPAGLTEASYTQWEFILARHHQRRLSVYLARDDYKPDRAPATYDRPDIQSAFLTYVHSLGSLHTEFSDANELCRWVLREDWPPKIGRKPKNLPFASLGPLFKGREKFLNVLHSALAAAGDGKAAAVVGKAVHGLGGVGKTRVAIEYAWRHAWEYSALLFVPAETPERMSAGLAALVGVDTLDLPEKDEREDAVKRSAALRWLEHHPTWLMILDNVDDREAAEAVEQLLPKLSGGRVLITARNTNFAASVQTLELDVLSTDDATEFLLERTQGKRREAPDDGALARPLATELGGLALGLEQAGAYIAAQRIGFERYLKLWKESRAKVLGWFNRSLMSYNHDVGLAATWATSVEKLTPAGRRLLERLAFFAPDPIPESLLDVAILPPSLAIYRNSEIAMGEGGRHRASEGTPVASDGLLAAGWGISSAPHASRRPSGPPQHEGEELPDETNGPHAEEIAERSSRSTRADHTDCDAREALADLDAYSLVSRSRTADGAKEPSFAIHRLVQDFTRLGLEEAKRRQVLEEALGWLNAAFIGDPQDVRDWLALDPLAPHALALVRTAYKARIPRPTAQLMHDLGRLLHSKAKYLEAESLLRDALAFSETILGPDHPHVATCLSSLALLLKETSCLAEAEPLLHRALAIDEANYGPEHPNIAIRLNNLASLLAHSMRLAEAEPLYRRALAIAEAYYEPTNPAVVRVINNLAQLLHDKGCLAEAEPLMRRALAIDEENFGRGHPDVAIRLNNLASLLRDMKRHTEAEPLYRDALAIDEASYGLDHPRVATSLNNLAQSLQDEDRCGEAEPLMRRALAIDEASFGPDHPNVATDLNNLAQLLQDTDRLAEAEPLMRRAVTLLFSFPVQTYHAQLVDALNTYHHVLLALGHSEAGAIIEALARKHELEIIANPSPQTRA